MKGINLLALQNGRGDTDESTTPPLSTESDFHQKSAASDPAKQTDESQHQQGDATDKLLITDTYANASDNVPLDNVPSDVSEQGILTELYTIRVASSI